MDDRERLSLRRLQDVKHSNMTEAKYGFDDKETAERLRDILAERHPDEKFEVEVHSRSRMKDTLTWGVVRYVPYCEAMPWRCTGFVDFMHDPEAGDLLVLTRIG
jgi:CRISPR/Cas system-associated exonuclease Cas4 (RecB family)